MDYLENYKKMISLRGLTDHTMTSYCTYVTAYLDFVANTLHVQPSEVGYPDTVPGQPEGRTRSLGQDDQWRDFPDPLFHHLRPSQALGPDAGPHAQVRHLPPICPVTGRDQTVHLDHDGHQAEGYGRPYVFLRPADR